MFVCVFFFLVKHFELAFNGGEKHNTNQDIIIIRSLTTIVPLCAEFLASAAVMLLLPGPNVFIRP